MASKFDKSLEEIIREKGIQNPTIKKKKTQTPKFLKTISKKSYWQKIANEDGKTFEAPAKCSVNITGMVYLFHFVLNLINKRHGSRILNQRIWPPNHRSYTKVYFNEVVANALRGNIGIVNFGL